MYELRFTEAVGIYEGAAPNTEFIDFLVLVINLVLHFTVAAPLYNYKNSLKIWYYEPTILRYR